jgi:phospholipase C
MSPKPLLAPAVFFTVASMLPAALLAADGTASPRGDLQWIKHIVVIYMENHSFDNLYGRWEAVNGEKVNGLDNVDGTHVVQVSQSGTPFNCLLQNDPNLTAPSPLPASC